MSALAMPRDALWLPGDDPLADLSEKVRERARRYLGRVQRTIDEKFGLSLMAGFSNAAELEVLDSVFGDHASINLYTAPTYLALTTVAVGETDTGSTITEANYTGYARKSLSAAEMAAAAAGSKSNSAQQTFAGCTAGSSVVIGWGTCSASTAGTLIVFGTCTSTTISTTQTPASVAASGLVVNLD